jgi:uncharacterized phiE125 gp8 family phage protein
VVTEPADGLDPVDLSAVKAEIGVEEAEHDGRIRELILEATRRAEVILGVKRLMSATLRKGWDAFPPEPFLRLQPRLTSVSALTYVDTAGATQTWDAANYVVDAASLVGELHLAWGIAWPAIQPRPYAVQATFLAGYQTQGEIPASIKRAIKFYAVQMFWLETSPRTTVRDVLDGFKDLLWPERVLNLGLEANA